MPVLMLVLTVLTVWRVAPAPARQQHLVAAVIRQILSHHGRKVLNPTCWLLILPGLYGTLRCTFLAPRS